MSFTFRQASRLTDLPPYLFAELDRRVAAKRAEGADVISFGIGDPDFPTPPHIVDAMKKALDDESTHHYPSYAGLPELRQAIAVWMQKRFGVKLDPDTQILPIWGSKEGIAHLPLASVDDGDVVLCADPGYPTYDTITRLVGARPVAVPVQRDNGFIADLSAVGNNDAERARLLWLNYPGNPTGATCDVAHLADAVEFCRRNDVLLVHDAAYSEVTYDGYRAPSVLEVPGATDLAVEIDRKSVV